VRDAICALAVRDGASQAFHLPVVAETYDGWLNEIESFPLTRDHVFAAFDNAVGDRPIAEGNVGGGTGMICHEFKGGTGTASRLVRLDGASYTLGALVQANYGSRALLRVGGAPIGQLIGHDRVPAHRSGAARVADPGGSIIVVLATDAPLLPIQCQRLARRATTGLAWVGGIGANGSGDIFLAFSTANHVVDTRLYVDVRMLAPEAMNDLFLAAAEATQEAILNALCMAETMQGRNGRIVHALPLDLLQTLMRPYL
jgi:D-aminopeptidase